MKARRTPAEDMLYNLGFKVHTRAVGTLIRNIILVERYGIDEFTAYYAEVSLDEIRDCALKGGIRLRIFVEETWSLTQNKNLVPLGMGTAPQLLIGWYFRDEYPERYRRFLRAIYDQRGSGDTAMGRLLDYLRSNHVPGRGPQTSLAPEQIMGAVLRAWDSYKGEAR